MKIKMKLQQRETTRLACAYRPKLIESAKKATGRALVDTIIHQTAEGLTTRAVTEIPKSKKVTDSWEVPHTVVVAYRDSLFLLGMAVAKVAKKEIESGVETTASEAKLEEIRDLLRVLGDQRELFAADDDTEQEDDGQLDIEEEASK